jgi:nitroreductase
MTPIDLLLTRNSHARLTEPAPDDAQLNFLLQAALRAPDHARMSPRRFLKIAGAARERLGEVFVAAQLARNAVTDADKLDKLRLNPLRAPLVLVAIARLTENTKVPLIEQRFSAACSAHAILLAAHALGFGAMWRTGDMAYDNHVTKALGLAENEEIVGFLYLGTRQGDAKSLPAINSDDYLAAWN